MIACTPSVWGLAIGLALAGATSGIACGAAQAMLIVSNRGDADRVMVRWSLYCAIGDVLTPLVTAAAIALGHSYRGAMAVAALVVAAQCIVSTRLFVRENAPAETSPDSTPAADRLRAALARAARLPRLWAWLMAAASCTLLDELVIALSALRLARDRGASGAAATAAAVGFAAGSVVGATMADRAIRRFSSRQVLLASGVLCALGLAAFLETDHILTSSCALFVIGLTCAPHHPLAQARAYAELPDRPGTVQAVGQLFVVVDVVAPLALGFIADRFGITVAIGCLLAQPVMIVAVRSFSPQSHRAGRPEPRSRHPKSK